MKNTFILLGITATVLLSGCGTTQLPQAVLTAQASGLPTCTHDSRTEGTAAFSPSSITVYRTSPPTSPNTAVNFTIPAPLTAPGTITVNIQPISGFSFSWTSAASSNTQSLPLMVTANTSVNPGTYNVWMLKDWSRLPGCPQEIVMLNVTVK